jgi:hypothetical protein
VHADQFTALADRGPTAGTSSGSSLLTTRSALPLLASLTAQASVTRPAQPPSFTLLTLTALSSLAVAPVASVTWLLIAVLISVASGNSAYYRARGT